MNKENIKFGWLIFFIIGLILLFVGLLMIKSFYPFFIFIGYLLFTLGFFFSIYGLIEKISK
jgi:hypothetical protein